MCTVKDLMKHCNSAGVHQHIALLEFLCTPGPDGHSPSELLGRQFRGILPMINTNTVNSSKFAVRKNKEKEKFDDKHPRELKPLLVGSTMSYLNSDLKTWNVGIVVAHSPDNRSYHIKAESGQVTSRNRVHLHETNVEFVPQVQNILKVSKVLKDEKSTVKSPSSNTQPKQSVQKQIVKSTVCSNDNYRTRSGCEVRKPPRYR